MVRTSSANSLSFVGKYQYTSPLATPAAAQMSAMRVFEYPLVENSAGRGVEQLRLALEALLGVRRRWVVTHSSRAPP